MASWKDFGGPVRVLGTAIVRAVDAVGDADDYPRATAELATPPAGLILGGLVRSMLEDQHPDGLDSDDIEAVLVGCYRAASAWTVVDANVLLAVLASALGIHEPGVTYDDITAPERTEDEWTSAPIGGTAARAETPPTKAPSPTEYAYHAPILIAHLIATGRRGLNFYLDAAFTATATEAAMEMP
ncbi:MAG TPA: hypothetical protein VGJ28_21955 [Micromonosporaceae bacterium]